MQLGPYHHPVVKPDIRRMASEDSELSLSLSCWLSAPVGFSLCSSTTGYSDVPAYSQMHILPSLTGGARDEP